MEDIKLLGFKEISDMVKDLTAEEVKDLMSHVSQEQMLAVANATNEQNDIEWRAKTLAMIEGIKEKNRIETIGGVLTPTQILAIIDHLSLEEQWKISALFVGLSADQFSNLLIKATPKQMKALCHESLNEPIQHQLRVLCKEWMKSIDLLCNQAMEMEKDIAEIDISKLTHKTLLQIIEKISEIQAALEQLKRWESKALQLTWNSNSIDLVEKFSVLKDLTHRSLMLIIGSQQNDKNNSQGLFGFLEQKLTSTFHDLNDEDSPFEALSRFSLWYLEDYWKLGLIPSVKSEKDLEATHYSEEEYEKLRTAWMEEAKLTLESLGLDNVGAFKGNAVFSANMLKDYISRRQKSEGRRPKTRGSSQ